jgi:sortase B
VQTPDDPEYYLRRNFAKEHSVSGTIFAAGNSDLSKPSDVITIYGHHMKNSQMFGDLKHYTEKKYYKKHRYIRLDTLEQRFNYEVVAVFKVSVAHKEGVDPPFPYYQYTDFADENDYNNYMALIKHFSLYDTGVDAEYGDQFIQLSTCEYTQKHGRLVVVGKRIPNEGAPVYPKTKIKAKNI